MAESRTPRHVRRKQGARSKKDGAASGGRASRTPARPGSATKTRPLVSGRARLQKILAGAGLGSRRTTEQYLRDGRVTVNGRTAKLGDSADLTVDVVALDGEKLGLRSPSYWILNKPTGVVTTLSDPERRATVADFLPPKAADLFPVGRLDIDTSGLVLLTNDGALTQTLLHPSSGGEKEYQVVVKGEVQSAAIRRLEKGLVLDDGRTKPARVDGLTFDVDRGVSTLRLVLTEGRKRQIRRAMLVLGHPVKTLRRVRIGPLRLGRLRRGEVRPLRPGEIAALLAYVERLRMGEEPALHAKSPAAAPPTPRVIRSRAGAKGRSSPRDASRPRAKRGGATRGGAERGGAEGGGAQRGGAEPRKPQQTPRHSVARPSPEKKSSPGRAPACRTSASTSRKQGGVAKKGAARSGAPAKRSGKRPGASAKKGASSKGATAKRSASRKGATAKRDASRSGAPANRRSPQARPPRKGKRK